MIFFLLPLPLAPRIWQLYRKASFLSNWCTFTFTHSAIPQVKGKSGHWEKKKKTASPNAQSCSSLIRLETYCGRCKIISPPSLTLWVLQCVLKNYGRIHFLVGFDVETYCSFPCFSLHWFTVVFGPSISTGMHFFHSIYLSCFLGMQHPFSSAKQASMLASFNVTGFQHFDKDATVTSAVLGASVVSL